MNTLDENRVEKYRNNRGNRVNTPLNFEVKKDTESGNIISSTIRVEWDRIYAQTA